MNAVQAALTKSGTVTLELARMGVPMIVAHKVSLLTWWIGKRLLICPWVALPNILSKSSAVPEYLQHLDAQTLANELISVQEQRVDLSSCGQGGAYERMANHCERIILRQSHTGQML